MEKKIYFLGDLHGKWDILMSKIVHLDITDIDIVQVGDFGVGFDKNEDVHNLIKLGKFLQERNINMYVIRGNHDDPKYFDDELSIANLHLVPDYTILELNGKKLLLVGGGVSIDREHRTQDINWWSKEQMYFNENIEKQEVDIIVTHVPSRKYMVGHINPKFGHFIQIDIDKEQEILDKIEERVDYKYWVSGHFHLNSTNFINDKIYYIVNELDFIEI